MSNKAAVLLADGFEEIEAVTPVDILRRAGFDVVVAGVGGLTLTGSRALKVSADTLIDHLDPDLDILVLPGGGLGARNLGMSPQARTLTERVIAAGGIVGAICAAPVLTLGAWGLLSGKKATCFPGMENKFPKDVLFSVDPVVIDGKIVTSRGAGTAMVFSLALIKSTMGEEKVEEIARTIVLS